MNTITIVKDWDGNESVKEANNRLYVSHGRWQWVVFVNGEPGLAFNSKREARAHADELATALKPVK